MNISTEERFWKHVHKTDGCWFWLASTINSGYGQFYLDGGKITAHRYAYELKFEKIPEGKKVLHRCDNRTCVRWSHLFVGTSTDNSKDAASKGRANNQNSGKTVCSRGHKFTVSNTYTDNLGHRQCRKCWKIQKRIQRGSTK